MIGAARASYRLHLAAMILRAEGVALPPNSDAQVVLATLNAHPERERIKGLVDWIEDYDPEDELG